MLSPSITKQLQAELKGVSILTPESEGYEASLKRWSETAEKRAVSPSTLPSFQPHKNDPFTVSRVLSRR